MQKWFFLGFWLISSITLFSQQKYTLSGYVKDASSGEELIGATIKVKGTSTGAVTNLYGFYSLSLPEGTYDLVYSFVGFQNIEKSVSFKQNQKIDIELSSGSLELQEVQIVGEKIDDNVKSVGMSTVNVNMETLKKIPALMGEVDVIRSIQLLPGVQSAGEGSTGFFVRGGGVDQNLVLLDEASVFNAAHLLGFFSVFNSDAIKDAQLYKGGIPARYGGRLSSVLDIRMKEGNSKKLSVNGGIGLISSRLTIEGPIVKDKASFMISGRRTYADLFLKLSNNDGLKKSKLYFYDMNGKANYKLGEKDRIFVSGYFGQDVLSIANFFTMNWGNQTLTTRWNHLFTEKLFSNVSLIYSNYSYQLGMPEGVTAFEWNSNIINYSLKNDYTYYAGTKNTIKFGFQSTLIHFKPAEFIPLEDNEVATSLKLPNKYALESGIYISNEQKIGANLTIDYGLRWSFFQNMGPDTVYQFNEVYDTIPGAGTKVYSKGDLFNAYNGFEPRLAINYSLTETSSVKFSYNRMYQYLHLAVNSTSGTPLDIWFPCSPNVAPRRSDQIALGYFRNFSNNMFETSVEVYYKTLKNDIDFKDNAKLIFNRLLEGEIRIGQGRSYGAEFFIRKQQGKLNGWISYTYSRAFRTVAEINDGLEYSANYDRPHNVSFVLTYDLSKKWNFGLTWVYVTGVPLTVPNGKFQYQGMQVPIYSARNEERVPDYHRGDVSATYTPNREGKKFKDNWNFSVYNMYARKNPFSVVFKEDPEDGKTKAYRTYLFSIIPTVTYNFNF
jgi:hypothetical protein